MKPLSGSQKRTKKRVAELVALIDKDAESKANSDPQAHVRELYLKLGPPPIGDPEAALVWANQAMLVELYGATVDPIITSAERRKLVSDFGSKIGMTYSKVRLANRVIKLEEGDVVEDEDGLESNPLALEREANSGE